MGDATVDALLGSQRREPPAVPLRPRSVTATLGSCVVPPGTRTFRNEVSTVEYELCEMLMKSAFCRRVLTASGDVLTPNVAATAAASVAPTAGVAAPPRSANARARPTRASPSVTASLAVVAAVIALSNRIFASAKTCADLSSGRAHV